MSRNYFANTDETETHYLEEPSDLNRKGVYVKIKTRLSWGERKRLDSAAIKTMSVEQIRAGAEGKPIDGVEPEPVGTTATYGLETYTPQFLKLACHVIEWNLPGIDGRPVRLPRSIDEKARLMERLDEEIGDEIAAFIDRIVEAQQKALAAAKQKDEDGHALNGQVTASSSTRVIDGRAVAVDDEGNPTPPPVGLVPSGGWRQE